MGFDKFADYVLGKEDGVAKTPKWAAEKCGVPSYTIKALAREFAEQGDVDHALVRRLHDPRSVLERAGPARSGAAGHAGFGQAGRAPGELVEGIPPLCGHAHRGHRGPSGLHVRLFLAAAAAGAAEDPHREGHLLRRALHLLGQRRPDLPDLGPAQAVHLSHTEGRGRQQDPHDLERHALPHHLLGPRQPRGRGSAASRRSSVWWSSIPGWRTTPCSPTSSCR